MYKSLQLLKAELKGNVMTIAQLVESQLKPSTAECIECFNKGYASEVVTTDFRLALPDVFPVMAGRERVGSLTPWTDAQYAAFSKPCFGILSNCLAVKPFRTLVEDSLCILLPL